MNKNELVKNDALQGEIITQLSAQNVARIFSNSLFNDDEIVNGQPTSEYYNG